MSSLENEYDIKSAKEANHSGRDQEDLENLSKEIKSDPQLQHEEIVADIQEMNLKIVVVGDSGVGKSTLLYRFTKDGFLEHAKATIGIDLLSYETKINGINTYVQFWDTAGQEKFRGMASTYYKSCHGVLLVYDITNKPSFEHLDYWLTEIKTYADKEVIIFVAGNKLDLEYTRRVNKNDLTDFSTKHNLKCFEVSAKKNDEKLVNKAIDELINLISKKNKNQKDKQTQKKYLQARDSLRNFKSSKFVENYRKKSIVEQHETEQKRKCC